MVFSFHRCLDLPLYMTPNDTLPPGPLPSLKYGRHLPKIGQNQTCRIAYFVPKILFPGAPPAPFLETTSAIRTGRVPTALAISVPFPTIDAFGRAFRTACIAMS